MIAYEYEHFKNDLQALQKQCAPFEADTVLAVARGGMTLAHALSMALDIRNLQSIRAESYDGDVPRDTLSVSGECDLNRSHNVLIVDDIVDSGRTLSVLIPYLRARFPHCTFKVATLFTKTTALVQPDFFVHEARDWIDFFWEKDYRIE
ncbi:MAG: phosphoribosyltransferase family protein [Sulfuricurvum sp.]|nr:phosphoribosyltransferase family protein [Sulfuricurvum sp.]